MILKNPQLLYLLFLLPPLIYYQWRQRRKEAIRYSALSLLEGVEKTWRQRLLFLPGLCGQLVFIALIIALSRPQVEVTNERQDRQGIAIEMLIDVSSSMDINIRYGDKNVSRMEVAKQVVEEFVAGNEEEGLTGRPDDLIGIITFARYADTICPITLGHDALVYMVRELTINERPNEDGTAYGDAAALAAARLKALEGKDDSDVASKVIVLLTDGENNCGRNLPLQAAALAKEWGIRIYTISLQEKAQPSTKETKAGTFLRPEERSTSEQLLEKMAEMTGGLFRTAHDFDSLQAVYKEIDQLEKTKMKAVNYKDLDEAFMVFAIAALILLGLQHLLRTTVLRVSP